MACHDDFGQSLNAEIFHFRKLFTRVSPLEQLFAARDERLQLTFRFLNFVGQLAYARRVRVVGVKRLYLVERKAQSLQFADGAEPLHLFHGVVPIARPLVHLVRHEQPFLFVVPQGFDRYLHQLRELSDS